MIIILIPIIILLYDKKNELENKNEYNISIESKLGIVEINPNVLVKHLNDIHDTIEMGFTHIDSSYNSELNTCVLKSIHDLQVFIQDNARLIDKTVLMQNDQELLLSYDDNKLKIILLQKINTANNILNTHLNSDSRNKLQNDYLYLQNIYEIVRIMEINYDGCELINYNELFETKDESPSLEKFSGKSLHKRINKSNFSQDNEKSCGTYDSAETFTNEAVTPHYKNEIRNPHKKENKFNNELTSHLFNESETVNTSKKKQKKYEAFYNINNIKEKRIKDQKIKTDTKFNRSLRNDYDFLEE
jgi:hypothetical protein